MCMRLFSGAPKLAFRLSYDSIEQPFAIVPFGHLRGLNCVLPGIVAVERGRASLPGKFCRGLNLLCRRHSFNEALDGKVKIFHILCILCT